MVGKERAGGLHVARARELELEADALLVSLPAQLIHLGAQLLSAPSAVFAALCDLALELRDARVALGERRLVIRARLGDAAVDPEGRAAPCGSVPAAAHLRRRALRLLRPPLVDLLRLVLQAIHLPVPFRKAGKEKPAPIRWVQAMGWSQDAES